jgi:flagellar hook-associated protein FlgK
VVDLASGSVLAERAYDPADTAAVIDYRGLQLRLSKPPLAGDRFTIDGNRSGVGDNRAMLDLAALGDADLLPGRLTLQNAYLQHSSGVGNVARQATIAEEALTVVYQQSVQLRENVAGVNLDEEAADLIRLQQAYQASARVMQTATTMFDTLLQIR